MSRGGIDAQGGEGKMSAVKKPNFDDGCARTSPLEEQPVNKTKKPKNRKAIAGLVAAAATWIGASTSANATLVNLATQGVGYVRPTLLGSAFTITELDNMINVYNGTAVSP